MQDTHEPGEIDGRRQLLYALQWSADVLSQLPASIAVAQGDVLVHRSDFLFGKAIEFLRF